MKNKKVLIIGDSNCMPRYHANSDNIVRLEDNYVYKLKKELFENFTIEQFTLGGVTTSELLNRVIPYYAGWEPDYVIIQSGINDTKNQFISTKNANFLFKFFNFFGISKHYFKSNILYNKKLIKLNSISKVSIKDFSNLLRKIKNIFSESKIFWFEIFSDENINNERPGTLENINQFNKILKEEFNDKFISLEILNNKKHFTPDGYHLNVIGQDLLFKKILFILKNN